LGRITFRVGYGGGRDAQPVEGRVLVAMTSLAGAASPFDVGFMRLRDEWVASAEIGPLAPGGHVDIDPDALAWPRPFSTAPVGTYRIAARLVHSGHADLGGVVVERNLDPAHAGQVDVTFASGHPAETSLQDSDGVKIVSQQSRLLTAFYGRPISLDAIVELPAGYAPTRKYTAEYYVRALGNSFAVAHQQAEAERRRRIDAGYP